MVTSGLLTILIKSVLVKTKERQKLDKRAKKAGTRSPEGAEFRFDFNIQLDTTSTPKCILNKREISPVLSFHIHA